MKKRTQSKANTKVKKKAVQKQQNAGPQSTNIQLDRLKWLGVFLLLLLSIAANYYYSSVALAIRSSVGILVVCAMLCIAYYTEKGQAAFEFIKSAKNELRMVVWPSRTDAMKTTFLVIGIVILTAIILWAFDSFFIWSITQIMNVK